ncbi:MAG: DUF3999 family protein, partial [Chthoniobacterales bacterium]
MNIRRSIILLPAMSIWVTGAFAFNQAEWQFRQTLEVPARGLARVNLPVETLDVAQPDLSDLRIVDGNGREVSYLIDQPQPQTESKLRAGEFRAEIVSGETRLTITTGTEARLMGVTLEVAGDEGFIKAVRVEGSHDQKQWQLLTTGQPIFRERPGAANLRVSFPENGWQFFRVVLDDNRTQPIPVTGAQLHTGGSPAPFEPVPITIISRDENLGVTRLALDLGASNLRISSVRIETPDPLFTRTVRIAIPRLSGDAMQEETLCTGLVYRVDLNGKTESRLDLPVEAQIRGRELILLLDNGDSSPLAISAVGVERRLARLIFFAPEAGSYGLVSGNSQCVAPRYDITQLGDQLRNLSGAQVQLSPIAPNPHFKAPTLPQGMSSGAKIDLTPWKFREPVETAKSGAAEIEFDIDLLARASADFRDIRLVRDGAQLPFLFEHTSISRAIPLVTTLVEDRDHPRLSRWSVKLPQASLPVSQITCASSSGLFERSIRVWEEPTDERGDKYPRERGRATWRRTPDQSTREFIV